MPFGFRFLIVCFIALALPVQGMASAVMAHCGQSHQRLPAAQGAAQHHRSADPGSTADRHGMATAMEADAVATPTHAPSGKFTEFSDNKCSACGSCCAVSALPSVMARVPQPAFAPMVFAETTVTVHAYATDGPDRPPRS